MERLHRTDTTSAHIRSASSLMLGPAGVGAASGLNAFVSSAAEEEVLLLAGPQGPGHPGPHQAHLAVGQEGPGHPGPHQTMLVLGQEGPGPHSVPVRGTGPRHRGPVPQRGGPVHL